MSSSHRKPTAEGADKARNGGHDGFDGVIERLTALLGGVSCLW